MFEAGESRIQEARTATDQGPEVEAEVGDPAVLLVGPNCSILAASPRGMRFVQEAAGWVAEEVRQNGKRRAFGEGVLQVLSGKSSLVCMGNPLGRRGGGGTSSQIRIVPAYGREGEIFGALVVVDSHGEARGRS